MGTVYCIITAIITDIHNHINAIFKLFKMPKIFKRFLSVSYTTSNEMIS
jgi:hypothetical protein